MPGKLKAKIVAGRHLPVMDRASDLTDAFVEVKFGNTTFKTDVFPKSLNPQWNSEWFKFEVDDEDLQDEPLQITVLDHDTYSANDAIGKVYIDIDPLLSCEAATVISGWFPIYDTIHGIRGEIYVLVKVDLFNDLNRFRQSSCGVKFFCTTSIPRCYRVALVHGFVEELVVNEDPEYQWIDRIRTPRASNEARQRLISLMSGELQRKIGLKVLEMGGNAVVGYLQCFDLEGESGLVVRAIGTACTLDKLSPGTAPNTTTHTNTHTLPNTAPTSNACNSPSKDSKEPVFSEDPPPPLSVPPTPLRTLPSSSSPPPFSPSKPCSRQSSSSDTDLSLTPKMGTGSVGSVGKEVGPLKTLLRQHTQSALVQREFPFFTLTCFPPGFLVHVGGVVSTRSVKLLDRIHNPDEPETRDAWWEEIRQEIKSHAKALGCHAVVGYSESTSICEEVCILSASGTAAMLNPRFMREGCLDTGGSDHRLSRQPHPSMVGSERGDGEVSSTWLGFEDASPPSCGFCHIPYDEFNMPFPAQLTYCYHCRRQKVPDVLFTTIDLPAEAAVTGKGCLIQARLCRTKKKAQGEVNATAISNLLPFMEYELHTQLMNKLKLRSMNALFGLRIQISVGENMLLGLASATGVYLSALPAPGGIQIASKTPSDLSYDQHISTMQKRINDTIAKNKELYNIHPPKLFTLDPEAFTSLNTECIEEVVGSPIPDRQRSSRLFRSTSESSDELSELDLSHGKKDAFVLEIDDTDAVEDIQSLLTDAPIPAGFYSCNTEVMPGIYNWTSGLQMFTSVRVYRLSNANLTNQGLNKIFTDLCENLLKSLYFKLRSMIPCCLCHLNFTVAVPEEELIQVAVTAVAMSFDKETQQAVTKGSGENEEQLQFSMELCGESTSSNNQPTAKPSGVPESVMVHSSSRGKPHPTPSRLPWLPRSCFKFSSFCSPAPPPTSSFIYCIFLSHVLFFMCVCIMHYVMLCVCGFRYLCAHAHICGVDVVFSLSVCVCVCMYAVCVCVYFSPAPSVDYGSFADRCSTWLELLRLKAHTIRRGSVKTSRRTQLLAHSVSSSERCSPLPEGRSRSLRSTRSLPCSAPVTVVKMTPLSFLPGTRIVKYLGIINMFFIRETTSLREEGGVSGFLHSFIAEVFAMVRAHVAALGGNALVSYSMKECVFMENPNKNQAQCLINVSGDAVIFIRESDQEAIPPLLTSRQTSSTGADGTT
ncbi:C2 domain-containing protein 5-like isoform X2 [Coregonus clupeaformis]|uniref:C2 domain-containing protein 5-like isoform X2 n=1 Tax=Coregonus clupeaformis TaxID=59861 RepID=UPI001E1C2903|nr:C2 domain-containing protein 5-like isoform X2 [Coregonus clupeaformis]